MVVRPTWEQLPSRPGPGFLVSFFICIEPSPRLVSRPSGGAMQFAMKVPVLPSAADPLLECFNAQPFPVHACSSTALPLPTTVVVR